MAVALFGLFLAAGNAAEPARGGAACVNLVLDGDSISYGWGASPAYRLDVRLAAALGGDVRLHNVAEGGRPVSTSLRLYNRLVAPLFDRSTSHNVIVFHGGDNDISEGRNATQTYVAFTAYVAEAHRQGWKVVVSTELQRLDFYRYQLAALKRYNIMLLKNKAGADAVVDFDADRRMTEPSDRRDPGLFSHDGIHPSNGGYGVLAGMLAPVVRRVAGR